MGYPYGQPDYPQPNGVAPAAVVPFGHPAHPQTQGPQAWTQHRQHRPSTVAMATLLAMLLTALTGVAGGMTLNAGAKLDRETHGAANDAAQATVQSLYATGVIEFIIALLWLISGFLLFNSRSAGRIMLIVLSAIGVVGGLVGIIAGLGSGAPMASVGGFVGITLALLVLSLTMSSGTTRWIAAAPPRLIAQSGQPYGQPARPPYGQPALSPYGQPVQPYAQPAPYSQPAPYGQPAQPYAQPAPYGQPVVAPYGQVPDPYQQPQPGQYPQQPTGQPPYPYQ